MFLEPNTVSINSVIAESKVDEDPAWPAIASQLIDLPRTRDDSSALLATTGLALRVILRQLDQSAGFTISKDEDNRFQDGYLIDYATGDVSRTKYSFHKLCNCRILD